MERYYDIDGNFMFECYKLSDHLSYLIRERRNAITAEMDSEIASGDDSECLKEDSLFYTLIQMQRIDFSKKDVDFTCVSDIDFSNSSFEQSCLYWDSFQYCKLDGVNFRDCDLRGVNFFDCTFVNTDFSGADLGYSNVGRGAHLCSADLSTAIFNETNLIGIEYDETTIWPKGFTPPPSCTDEACAIYIQEYGFMDTEEKSLLLTYGKVRNRNPAFWPNDVPKPNK